MVPPWDDCKIAFGIDDDEPLWKWHSKVKPRHRLPKGWSLTETDGAGARLVAVFRVNIVPTVEDGAKVQAFLVSIGAVKEQGGE